MLYVEWFALTGALLLVAAAVHIALCWMEGRLS